MPHPGQNHRRRKTAAEPYVAFLVRSTKHSRRLRSRCCERPLSPRSQVSSPFVRLRRTSPHVGQYIYSSVQLTSFIWFQEIQATPFIKNAVSSEEAGSFVDSEPTCRTISTLHRP